MVLDTRPPGRRMPGNEPDLSFLRNQEDASVGAAPEWNEESDVEAAERQAPIDRISKQLVGRQKMNARYDRIAAKRLRQKELADASVEQNAEVKGGDIIDLAEASERVEADAPTLESAAQTQSVDERIQAAEDRAAALGVRSQERKAEDAVTVRMDNSAMETALGPKPEYSFADAQVDAWGPKIKRESIDDRLARKTQERENAAADAETVIAGKEEPRESMDDRFNRLEDEGRQEAAPQAEVISERQETAPLQQVDDWVERGPRMRVEEEAAQVRVAEAPAREESRSEVLAFAEGNEGESTERERRAQELIDQAFAATKTLTRFKLQRIHDVIRENKLEGGMVRKSDESLGPADIADPELGRQIAERMKKDLSSPRDAALVILGEAYAEAAAPLSGLDQQSLPDDMLQDIYELQDLIESNGAGGSTQVLEYLHGIKIEPPAIEDRAAA
jgi:hypothetical protein